MRYEEDQIEELMRLVAARIETGENADAYRDERFLAWLAEDLRAGLSGEERLKDEVDASVFARRISRRIAARRAEKKFPRRVLRQRPASSIAIGSESLSHAAREGCATLLDLAVAAGIGRELWEESCDEWLELPNDIRPSDRYIALRVAGESMSPVLEPRDVILIKLGSQPAIDELVVAHIPEQGYVVKYVSAIKASRIELSSFNHEYGAAVIPRTDHAILGTVIARFRHE